jgi:hypothetical protein
MDDKKKPPKVTDSAVGLSNKDDPEKRLLIETIVSDAQCLHAKVDDYIDQEHKMLCGLEDRLQAMEEAHITSINTMKDHIKEAIESVATSSRMPAISSATPDQSSSTLARMGSIPPQSSTLSSSRNPISRFRLFLFRGFTGPHRSNEPRNENDRDQQFVVEFRLEEDTYSLMMLSKPCSREWALGILTAFIFQLYLGILVLLTLYQKYQNVCYNTRSSCTPYNVPIRAPLEVTLAQGIAILLVLASQTDLLSSVYTLSTLRHKFDHVPWDSLIGEEGNRTLRQWNTRIMFPNVIKFIEGATIIFASFVVIIQSRDIIDLLKDFAAVLIISQADNIMFNLASGGYLGEHLSTRADDVRQLCIQIRSPVEESDDSSEDRSDDSAKSHGCNAYTVRSLFFFGGCFVMIGGWVYIVYGQYSGAFVKMRYPECNISYDYYFGNGICEDDRPYLNTEACGWDDGDCPAPVSVEVFSKCFVREPFRIANGYCDCEVPYFTKECEWDGGDCSAKECP